VIVTSVEDAVEAARGGAHRLEVVRDLDRGGLTPPIDLVRRIQRDVDLPLRVMVRESDGFACRSDGERRRLADAATALDGLGVDGLVVGWTRDDEIDEDTLACVLDAAPSSRATFHHAFDALPDPEAALRALARHPRIDRVLTRGLGTEARSAKVAGAGGLASRCATLTRYAGWAAPRVIVLPG
jgi:copper homeostasis protein